MRVAVDGNKYVFTVPEKDWRIHIKRYGLPWLVLEEGSNAIGCMMSELEEARSNKGVILNVEEKDFLSELLCSALQAIAHNKQHGGEPVANERTQFLTGILKKLEAEGWA